MVGCPEETLSPLVHFAGNLFGNLHEHGIAMDGQLEVSLVVQRHRRDLPQRVFSVEHPAVRAREESVRDISDAVFERRIRLCRGAGALNPLTLEVLRNLASDKAAVARILDLDLCSRDGGLRVQESNPLLVSSSRRSSLDASRHHCFPIRIQTSQGFQSRYGFRSENIRVDAFEVASDFQLSR